MGIDNIEALTNPDDVAPDANTPGDALPDELKHLIHDGEIVGDNVDEPPSDAETTE